MTEPARTTKPPIPGGRPLTAVPDVQETQQTDDVVTEAREALTIPPDGVTTAEITGDATVYSLAWLRGGEKPPTILYQTRRAAAMLRHLAGVTVTGGTLQIRETDPDDADGHLLVELEALAADAVTTGTTLDAVAADFAELITDPGRRTAIKAESSALTRIPDGDWSDTAAIDLFRIAVDELAADPAPATVTVHGDGPLANAVRDAITGRDLFTLTGADEDTAQPDTTAGLFDAKTYDDPALAIPKVDGVGIDRIALGFAGEVFLDRTAKDDVAIYNALQMGREVELRVAGVTIGTGAKRATNKDGDLDVVVGKKTLKIHTIYVLTPEEL